MVKLTDHLYQLERKQFLNLLLLILYQRQVTQQENKVKIIRKAQTFIDQFSEENNLPTSKDSPPV